jgi:hypothetical protein
VLPRSKMEVGGHPQHLHRDHVSLVVITGTQQVVECIGQHVATAVELFGVEGGGSSLDEAACSRLQRNSTVACHHVTAGDHGRQRAGPSFTIEPEEALDGLVVVHEQLEEPPVRAKGLAVRRRLAGDEHDDVEVTVFGGATFRDASSEDRRPHLPQLFTNHCPDHLSGLHVKSGSVGGTELGDLGGSEVEQLTGRERLAP